MKIYKNKIKIIIINLPFLIYVRGRTLRISLIIWKVDFLGLKGIWIWGVMSRQDISHIKIYEGYIENYYIMVMK